MKRKGGEITRFEVTEEERGMGETCCETCCVVKVQRNVTLRHPPPSPHLHGSGYLPPSKESMIVGHPCSKRESTEEKNEPRKLNPNPHQSCVQGCVHLFQVAHCFATPAEDFKTSYPCPIGPENLFHKGEEGKEGNPRPQYPFPINSGSPIMPQKYGRNCHGP